MKVKILAATLLLTMAGGAFANGNLAEVVAKGNREQALEMIQAGSDVNALRSDGTSALLYAIHQRDAELVKALVKAGADVNHMNEYGATTMGEAAIADSTEILRILLENGANANLANPEGETPLMIVARAGNLEAAELLLDHGADVNAREKWGGQSAAMWAAAQHQPEMLRLLIAHGADINAHAEPRLWDRRIINEPRPKDMNKGGFSPVQYAARENCIECIEVLAEAGADLDATDPDRVTALNLALINQHFEAAAALIEAGADVNKWDLFGRTPLYNAIDLNTLPVGGRPDIPADEPLSGYDIAKMLLERGADPNIQLKLRPPYRNAVFDRGADTPLSNGATPLMRAAIADDHESVALLLSHGALVDLPNARGLTPLMATAGVDRHLSPTRGHYKVQAETVETIRMLLEAGADINALAGDPADRKVDPGEANKSPSSADGQTALHGAAKMGWTQVVEFLLDNGARQVADAAGRTPFDLAMGRYPPAFLQPEPEPFVDTAKLLQERCMQDDNCTIREPVDFSDPASIK